MWAAGERVEAGLAEECGGCSVGGDLLVGAFVADVTRGFGVAESGRERAGCGRVGARAVDEVAVEDAEPKCSVGAVDGRVRVDDEVDRLLAGDVG